MTHVIRTAVLTLVRFAVIWLVDALSLLLASWVVPGLTLVDVDGTSRVLIAISAALVLAIVLFSLPPVQRAVGSVLSRLPSLSRKSGDA